MGNYFYCNSILDNKIAIKLLCYTALRFLHHIQTSAVITVSKFRWKKKKISNLNCDGNTYCCNDPQQLQLTVDGDIDLEIDVERILLSYIIMNGNKVHYGDVKLGVLASQITSLTIVYSNVYSGADRRKHQSSASLALVRGIPAQMASDAENVSIWWRHHVSSSTQWRTIRVHWN